MFYAVDLKNVTHEIHVFTKKKERDEWVDEAYETRTPMGAKSACYLVRGVGFAYLHGVNAYLPTSWRRSGYWKREETNNPSVYEVYDVLKRYHYQ